MAVGDVQRVNNLTLYGYDPKSLLKSVTDYQGLLDQMLAHDQSDKAFNQKYDFTEKINPLLLRDQELKNINMDLTNKGKELDNKSSEIGLLSYLNNENINAENIPANDINKFTPLTFNGKDYYPGTGIYTKDQQTNI